jgi:Transposase DDE domain
MRYLKKNIEVISPTLKLDKKYKLLCKNIYNQEQQIYISYDNDGNRILNVRSLMELLVTRLKPSVNEKYIRNKIFEEIDFIDGILEVIDNCTYWTRYKNGKINGSYLNKKHLLYCKWGVYDCLYKIMLTFYCEANKFEKFKYQSIDTTFVRNLYGSEMKGMNVQYKSKNGIKVSYVSDNLGVPISIAMAAGNVSDCVIAKEQINDFFIDPETKRVKKNNRYKQTMLADAAYYDNNFKKILRRRGYKGIIDVNPRNTKKPELLAKQKKDKEEYLENAKHRSTVEHLNAWHHKYPKLNRVIEKTVKSFKGLVLLGCSLIVRNKIR